jgi:hypothetical protein
MLQLNDSWAVEVDRLRHERDESRGFAKRLMPTLKPERQGSVAFHKLMAEKYPWLKGVENGNYPS